MLGLLFLYPLLIEGIEGSLLLLHRSLLNSYELLPSKKQYEVAREEYEAALQIKQSNKAASVGLGKVAVGERKYEEAQLILQPIADKNTTQIGAEAQYFLGKSQQEQGNYEEAIEEYAKVKILFEAFETWVSLGMYHSAESNIQLGNRGVALAILNEITEYYPDTDAADLAELLIDSIEGS